MNGEPKAERVEIENIDFSEAKSPEDLINLVGKKEEYKEVADTMRGNYDKVSININSGNLNSEQYSALIDCAPEEVRETWENLLNIELIISAENIDDFIKRLTLIPNITSTNEKVGNKPGSYYAEAINKVMTSSGGEESTGLKQNKVLDLISKLPRAFLIREKAKEFF